MDIELLPRPDRRGVPLDAPAAYRAETASRNSSDPGWPRGSREPWRGRALARPHRRGSRVPRKSQHKKRFGSSGLRGEGGHNFPSTAKTAAARLHRNSRAAARHKAKIPDDHFLEKRENGRCKKSEREGRKNTRAARNRARPASLAADSQARPGFAQHDRAHADRRLARKLGRAARSSRGSLRQRIHAARSRAE